MITALDSRFDVASPSASPRDKLREMKRLLTSPRLEFLMEAHNGMSARIVEEAGFRGIWASGLTISASLGVRDNNEASSTEVLDLLEFMSDATRIPILLDGDTGYGNFNNMQRLVRKLEQRAIAAVCIEDKLFPKTNSFIKGELQTLADVEEFSGKIKAGKDAQHHDDFSIVARCEAFVAGWGLGEALRRAEAYRVAGADAILIHSALAVPDEVLGFCREWANRSPVVIVPTIYYATPTDVFRAHDISVVIWANHLMRAAIKTMQATARTIHVEESLLSIHDSIVPVQEIFRLQGAPQLEDAEQRYLPKGVTGTRAVVLAASRGSELGELTAHRPKTMVGVAGKPILEHIAGTYKAAGVKDITVVRGYKKDAVTLPHLKYVDNDEFASTGELASLGKALDVLPADTEALIVSYGDVLFRKYVPEMLLEGRDELVIVVDTNWRETANRHRAADYVACSSPYSSRCPNRNVFLERVAADLAECEIHGEWMGFLKCGRDGIALIKEATAAALASSGSRAATMQTLFGEVLARGERIRVIYTTGHWLDIDSLDDVVAAGGVSVIDARAFVDEASRSGFELWSGVPCSYLQPFINFVLGAPGVKYVAAANEGDAVAIAAGAAIGGTRAVAMFQNSGLGNAVNPLTSLTFTMRIPVLLIVTWRGEPEGVADEPQHELMGAITTDLLSLMRIAWELFPSQADDVAPALARARQHMTVAGTPFAFVMRKDTVAAWPHVVATETRPVMPPSTATAASSPVGTRRDALVALKSALGPDAVVVATTGFTGRELYALGDAPNQFYMVGSMGCASSFGLGLALQQPARRVVVIDGDGAALMRLGAMSTIGYERPPNLLHVVLDNGCHESTGGQATVSASIDLVRVAEACGYPRGGRVDSLAALGPMINASRELTFLHVPIVPGIADTLPRPSIGPASVAARFREHIASTDPSH